MRRAFRHHGAGAWPEADAVGAVTLPFTQRHRRRIVLTDDGGQDFLLDLPNARQLAHGDGLELAGGGFVRVVAAVERVCEICADSPETLLRLAWHIGNRHCPVQVLAGGLLRVPADRVMVDMLVGLGATVSELDAPFQPEPGAYDHGLLEAPPPRVRWS